MRHSFQRRTCALHQWNMCTHPVSVYMRCARAPLPTQAHVSASAMRTCFSFTPCEGVDLPVIRKKGAGCHSPGGCFFVSCHALCCGTPLPLQDPQNECGTPFTTIHIMHTTKWTPSGTPPPKSVHTSRRSVPAIVLHMVKFSHFVHKVDAHVRLKNTLNRLKLPK